MSEKRDDGLDAYEVNELASEIAHAVVEQPIVDRGLSMLGLMAVAVVGVPVLIVLTLVWAPVADIVLDLVVPASGSPADPSGFETAVTLLIAFGPPLVALFFVLRWGLVHLPPNVRRYLTS